MVTLPLAFITIPINTLYDILPLPLPYRDASNSNRLETSLGIAGVAKVKVKGLVSLLKLITGVAIKSFQRFIKENR